jgi:Do/DeqQ family serine protease
MLDRFRLSVSGNVIALLLIVLGVSLASCQAQTGDAGSAASVPGQSPQLAGDEKSLAPLQYSFRQIAKTVLPVVVEINVTELVKQQVPQFDFPFNLPFPFGQQPGQGGSGGEQTFRQAALGSGIIVRHTGDRYFVLTNNHVVKDATDISVRLNNQKIFKAKVVGTDPRKDIALVSFDSRDIIPVAVLGDSNTLEVGDIVLAVGNPLGFESTLTMGVVSALGRHSPRQGEVATYTDYIQTDAAINPGNSGGALVNISGQVVGINTWIAAPSGGSIGLGFAIPIDNAKKDIDDFIIKGKVEYGWLGVQIGDIQSEDTFPGLARDLRLAGVNGAFVLDIFKGSPADRAGILPGDYITRVETTDIQNSDQLTTVVGGLEAGTNHDFGLIRNGEKKTLSVKIGLRDTMDKVVQDRNLWPGMTVVDITDQIRQQANISKSVTGVVVGNLSSQEAPTAIAGLRPGDVITAVNGQSTQNLMVYYKALNDMSRSQVTFRINRGGTVITLGVSR